VIFSIGAIKQGFLFFLK